MNYNIKKAMISYKDYQFIYSDDYSANFQINSENIIQLCISNKPVCTCKNFCMDNL